MGIPPKDPSRLNCIQLSERTGHSVRFVRAVKLFARDNWDNPFDDSGLCTVERLRAWLAIHTEFEQTLAIRRRPPKRKLGKKELSALALARGRKPPI